MMAVDNPEDKACRQEALRSLLTGATAKNPTSVLGVVLADFYAQGSTELSVKDGEEIYILFEINDWAFVTSISNSSRRGYIPIDYCDLVKDFFSFNPQVSTWQIEEYRATPVKKQPAPKLSAKRVLFPRGYVLQQEVFDPEWATNMRKTAHQYLAQQQRNNGKNSANSHRVSQYHSQTLPPPKQSIHNVNRAQDNRLQYNSLPNLEHGRTIPNFPIPKEGMVKPLNGNPIQPRPIPNTQAVNKSSVHYNGVATLPSYHKQKVPITAGNRSAGPPGTPGRLRPPASPSKPLSSPNQQSVYLNVQHIRRTSSLETLHEASEIDDSPNSIKNDLIPGNNTENVDTEEEQVNIKKLIKRFQQKIQDAGNEGNVEIKANQKYEDFQILQLSNGFKIMQETNDSQQQSKPEIVIIAPTPTEMSSEPMRICASPNKEKYISSVGAETSQAAICEKPNETEILNGHDSLVKENAKKIISDEIKKMTENKTKILNQENQRCQKQILKPTKEILSPTIQTYHTEASSNEVSKGNLITENTIEERQDNCLPSSELSKADETSKVEIHRNELQKVETLQSEPIQRSPSEAKSTASTTESGQNTVISLSLSNSASRDLAALQQAGYLLTPPPFPLQPSSQSPFSTSPHSHSSCCCCHHHVQSPIQHTGGNYLHLLQYLNIPQNQNLLSPGNDQSESGLGDTESIHSAGELQRQVATVDSATETKSVADNYTQTSGSLENIQKALQVERTNQTSPDEHKNHFSRSSKWRQSKKSPDYLIKPISPAEDTSHSLSSSNVQTGLSSTKPHNIQKYPKVKRSHSISKLRNLTKDDFKNLKISSVDCNHNTVRRKESDTTASARTSLQTDDSIPEFTKHTSLKHVEDNQYSPSTIDSDEDQLRLARYSGKFIDSSKKSLKQSLESQPSETRSRKVSEEFLLDPDAIDMYVDDQSVAGSEPRSLIKDQHSRRASTPYSLNDENEKCGEVPNKLTFLNKLNKLDDDIVRLERRMSLPSVSSNSLELYMLSRQIKEKLTPTRDKLLRRKSISGCSSQTTSQRRDTIATDITEESTTSHITSEKEDQIEISTSEDLRMKKLTAQQSFYSNYEETFNTTSSAKQSMDNAFNLRRKCSYKTDPGNKKQVKQRRHTLNNIQEQYMKLEEARLLHDALKHINTTLRPAKEDNSIQERSNDKLHTVSNWLENHQFQDDTSTTMTDSIDEEIRAINSCKRNDEIEENFSESDEMLI